MTSKTHFMLVNLLLLLGVVAACHADQDSTQALTQARNRMVADQIESRGIKNPRLLEALRTVERHRFVPPEYRSFAYDDTPLPIGHEQTISQPYIVALMTDLLDIDSTDKVLEIGTGSGYQAAILSLLASEVYTVEIVEPLAEKSRTLLQQLGHDNVSVRAGDGFKGWPDKAPFDGIIVTCAPTEIPPPLIEQLADSGKLVIPVGDSWQELVLLTKSGEKIQRQSITPVRFVPMTGEADKRRK